MKRILFTAVGGLALLAGPALAADLPNRKEPPMAPVVYAPPPFSWTGFYVGLNAGGSFGSNNHCLGQSGFYDFGGNGIGRGFQTWPYQFCGNGNNSDNGNFIGGGQVGYNIQYGSVVFGLEADIDWLGSSHSGSGTTFPFYYGDPNGAINGYDPYSGYYSSIRAQG